MNVAKQKAHTSAIEVFYIALFIAFTSYVLVLLENEPRDMHNEYYVEGVVAKKTYQEKNNSRLRVHLSTPDQTCRIIFSGTVCKAFNVKGLKNTDKVKVLISESSDPFFTPWELSMNGELEISYDQFVDIYERESAS